MIYIYPHDEHSNGARLLKEALGGRRILHRNSKFSGTKSTTVINWGAGKCPAEVLACHLLNKPSAVALCADKTAFFDMMTKKKGGRIPEWTTSKDEVATWLGQRKTVVARTLTRAKSGRGIFFFEDLANFVSAPLYTVYVKKKEEYRVHFAFDTVIDVQKKVLRKTDDNGQAIDPKRTDWRIRNLANGFVFIRNDVQLPEDVVVQAMACANASGLDFGAVDVVWNEQQGKAYVLEINTAPGLEGTTVTNYADAFRSIDKG